MKIQITGLRKQYGHGPPALDGIDLDLSSPGLVGLVGPNGAGKTTLMQILVGQNTPTSGSLTLDGVPLDPERLDFKQRLGYLPQDFGLYEELTVRQFLDYMACLKRVPKPRAKAVDFCIGRTGLGEKADARIRTLSGGQKQRVGIAQALLADPELLIVDEPTVGLDPEERIRFRNLFSEDSGRRLVILSTHIIEDVESVCNRLVVLCRGRILFAGTTSELVRRAEGHVGLMDLEPAQEAGLAPGLRITSRVVTGAGVSLRVVGDALPSTVRATTPSLEDAYVFCVGARENGR